MHARGHREIARKIDAALIEQVEEDGGVLHRHKIVTVVEKVLKAEMAKTSPYAYGGMCLQSDARTFSASPTPRHDNGCLGQEWLVGFADSGVDPAE